MTGNDVHSVPKKYEPNLPHGGATINDQKSDFGKKTDRLEVFYTYAAQCALQKSLLDHRGAQ